MVGEVEEPVDQRWVHQHLPRESGGHTTQHGLPQPRDRQVEPLVPEEKKDLLLVSLPPSTPQVRLPRSGKGFVAWTGPFPDSVDGKGETCRDLGLEPGLGP